MGCKYYCLKQKLNGILTVRSSRFGGSNSGLWVVLVSRRVRFVAMGTGCGQLCVTAPEKLTNWFSLLIGHTMQRLVIIVHLDQEAANLPTF